MAKKLTSKKAKEILHDKSVHGHPLTDKQRRFFGAIVGGAPIKAQDGIEKSQVMNILSNLPIYAPDARYAEYQGNIEDWRNNLNNVTIEDNPNLSDVTGFNTPGSYFNKGVPSPLKEFPYSGTVQLDASQFNPIDTRSRVLRHELAHGAFDGSNFLPNWFASNLENTARNPKGSDHKDLISERAAQAIGVRGDIINKYGLQPNAKIPRELYNDYLRDHMNTDLRTGTRTESGELKESLFGAKNATDFYNLLNMENIPKQKNGGWLDKFATGGTTSDTTTKYPPINTRFQSALDLANLAKKSQTTQTPKQKEQVKKQIQAIKKYAATLPKTTTEESTINPNIKFSFNTPISSDSNSALDRQLRQSGQYTQQQFDQNNNTVSNYRKSNPWAATLSDNEILQRAQIANQSLQNQETLKVAQPKEGLLSRTWNIASNPMTALSYKIKGQDIPEHFERGEKNILDQAVNIINPATYINSGAALGSAALHPLETAKTLTKAGVNLATNLVDNTNVYNDESNTKALSLLGDVGNALMLNETGLLTSLQNKVTPIIQASKESGLLSNTYKLNPWRFKPNSTSAYRMIGDEAGLTSAIESGQLKPSITGSDIDKIHSTTHYQIGVPSDTRKYFGRTWSRGYKGPYMAEVPNAVDDVRFSQGISGNEMGADVFTYPENYIPTNEATIYKQDWLRGYKPVEIPKTSLSDAAKFSESYNIDKSYLDKVNDTDIRDYKKYLKVWGHNTEGITDDQFRRMIAANEQHLQENATGVLKGQTATHVGGIFDQWDPNRLASHTGDKGFFGAGMYFTPDNRFGTGFTGNTQPYVISGINNPIRFNASPYLDAGYAADQPLAQEVLTKLSENKPYHPVLGNHPEWNDLFHNAESPFDAVVQRSGYRPWTTHTDKELVLQPGVNKPDFWQKSIYGKPEVFKKEGVLRKYKGPGRNLINEKNGGWLDKYGDGGTMQEYQENYNDNTTSYPPGFVGMGNDTTGRNYSPAWGGQFAMGGSLPGAVGFTYARTAGAAPSNGPYAKKTKASAENGTEMSYYQNGLDWKPKSISKNGSKTSGKPYEFGKSGIEGKGTFAKKDLKPGDYIGKVHTINQLFTDYDFTDLGRNHNHSDNPNVQNILVGNERHLVATKPIKKGTELTSNYRLQPDLEQPESFEKKGWLDKYK